MSEFENRRRIIAKRVFLQAWKYYRKSINGLSFSEALMLAWRIVRGMQRFVYSKVRGVTKENRQRVLARLSTYPETEISLEFQRESSNFYDSNAIKIMASVFGKGSACVGYLSADLAKEVVGTLDEGYTAVVFFLGITGIGKENLGVNFSFTILPIPTYNNNQKSPQLAS